MNDDLRQRIETSETPILKALTDFTRRERVSFHVPGHKSGKFFPAELAHWLDRALLLDQTELPGLDNLHQPEECILWSEELASRHYQSKRTFYSVNGSSAGIIAAILTVALGGRVLVVGDFHQSLWRGFVLADAEPVFLRSTWDAETLETVPPTAEMVRQALSENPDVSSVFVTSPTYTGRVADVPLIVKAAHDAGVPLVVDEAHGAHFGLDPNLPNHSVAGGADIVIQSVHKMLPALTQTAWVHLQGDFVSAERLSEALSTLQSTSPSYLLLSSLDAAQAWLRNHGPAAARESLEILAQCPFARRAPRFDPFRIWLPTGSLEESARLEAALVGEGLFPEYANPLGVLLMFGLQVRKRDVDLLAHVLDAAYAWEKGCKEAERASSLCANTGQLELRPREVEARVRRRVPVRDARNRVCGRMIVPYPPGVPILYPGQLLDDECADLLLWLLHSGTRTLGLFADGTIEVIE